MMIRKLTTKIKQMSTPDLFIAIGFSGIIIPFIAVKIDDSFIVPEDIRNLFGLLSMVYILIMGGLIGLVLISRKEIPVYFTTLNGLSVVIIGYFLSFVFFATAILVIGIGLSIFLF